MPEAFEGRLGSPSSCKNYAALPDTIIDKHHRYDLSRFPCTIMGVVKKNKPLPAPGGF